MPDGRDWFITQRLDYIDWRLLNHGSIRREHIQRAFGVSQGHASKDLALFQSLHPEAMRYDPRGKQYVPANGCYHSLRGQQRGPMTIVIDAAP